jgi:uncharacterized membrane-anchored protein YjiN (DUF445 family)
VIAALARGVTDALERPAFRATVTDVVDDLLQRVVPRLLLGFADLFGVIDRGRIVTALQAGLRDVSRDPDHPLRRQIEDAVAGLPRRLRQDGALAARVEALKTELLEGEVVARLAEEALDGLRRVLTADLARDESHIVAWTVERLEGGRRRLVVDAGLRAEIDRWLKARAVEIVERYHGGIATFIENGVRALGPEGAVRLIEEHAGDDLQYIRVNGTVVGGLAGGALYALHLLLKLL